MATPLNFGRGMSRLDCEQSFFCSKIRKETRKEELETTSARQRNMGSREAYVARGSEDERKERLHWFHTTI